MLSCVPIPIRSSTCAWPRCGARARWLAELIASWRARAGGYPDKLVLAMGEKSLSPQVLTDWAAREALASPGDDLAVLACSCGPGTRPARSWRSTASMCCAVRSNGSAAWAVDPQRPDR